MRNKKKKLPPPPARFVPQPPVPFGSFLPEPTSRLRIEGPIWFPTAAETEPTLADCYIYAIGYQPIPLRIEYDLQRLGYQFHFTDHSMAFVPEWEVRVRRAAISREWV